MARTFFNRTNFPLNQGGNVPGLQFKLTGNWEKTIRVIQKMGPEVKAAGIQSQMKIAQEVVKRVKAHLRNNDLGWKRLSKNYSYRKIQKGLDSRTLIAYGNYYHSIEVWRMGVGHMVLAGVKKGKYTRNIYSGTKSRLDIARIATVHEFSSGKRVPKRPLWNPTLAEMGGVPGIKEMYIKNLVRILRSKGIPVQQIKKIWR